MKPFYERSQQERLALAAVAIREGRTLIERWVALDKVEAEHWDARAAIAARLLADQQSIADYGCGTMNLLRHLTPEQRYVPVDLVARDANTIICDFNRDPPPPTGATAAAALGLLEYLYDVPRLLGCLHEQHQVLVVSYCVANASGAPANRREHGWVNDYTESQITLLFQQAGWHVQEAQTVGSFQRIWRLGAIG